MHIKPFKLCPNEFQTARRLHFRDRAQAVVPAKFDRVIDAELAKAIASAR